MRDQRKSEPKSALPPSIRTRMIDHELLRVFVAVVDYGGFTAAAQVLNRTQAAVSLQIKRLEESLDVALLEHPRRAVQLTPYGEMLLDYARRMLALNDEALSVVRSNELFGRVRIGATNNYASGILPPLLARFYSQHPEIQIELHTGVAADMEKKLGGTFDLIINLYRRGEGEGVLIDRQQPIWVGAKDGTAHLRDPLPLALLPHGSLFRQLALETLNAQGRRWHLAQESTNIAAIEAAVAAGLAVAVFHRAGVDFSRLRELTEEDGFIRLPPVDVRLRSAERYLSKASIQLREFLLEHLPRTEGEIHL